MELSSLTSFDAWKPDPVNSINKRTKSGSDVQFTVQCVVHCRQRFPYDEDVFFREIKRGWNLKQTG